MIGQGGATRPAAARRSYRVVGYLDAPFGIAIAARNTLRALEASGRSVERVTLGDRAAAGGGGAPPDPRAGEVTLFHLNPPQIAECRAAWERAVAPEAPTACVPFWELPLVPREWEPLLRASHAVLAPTRFVGDACARVLAPGRVVHYPQAVFLPDAAPDRTAWGFEPGTTVFLVSFDLGSDMDRKNPGAAIEAFRAAFPQDPDVRLVIKTKPWGEVPAFRAQARELRARIASDPRIRILDRALTYAEVMSLYASCDVMLALHRSEGLGLHLMEAMSLGRPVVATGWSGNMDFMSPADSVAVRYALVPVVSRHEAYAREARRRGQVWAEADVGHAARELRALRDSAERRGALGAAAADAMARRRREFLSGATFDAVEAALPPAAVRPAAFRRAAIFTRGWLYWKAIRAAPRLVRRRLRDASARP